MSAQKYIMLFCAAMIALFGGLVLILMGSHGIRIMLISGALFFLQSFAILFVLIKKIFST